MDARSPNDSVDGGAVYTRGRRDHVGPFPLGTGSNVFTGSPSARFLGVGDGDVSGAFGLSSGVAVSTVFIFALQTTLSLEVAPCCGERGGFRVVAHYFSKLSRLYFYADRRHLLCRYISTNAVPLADLHRAYPVWPIHFHDWARRVFPAGTEGMNGLMVTAKFIT